MRAGLGAVYDRNRPLASGPPSPSQLEIER